MTTFDLKEVVERAGPLEERRRALTDFARRADIVRDTMGDLVKEHPHKWVALTEGDEWFFADSIKDLLKQLEEAGKPLNRNVTKYLDPSPETWIL